MRQRQRRIAGFVPRAGETSGRDRLRVIVGRGERVREGKKDVGRRGVELVQRGVDPRQVRALGPEHADRVFVAGDECGEGLSELTERAHGDLS
jgi:hypothetical protein